MFDTIVALITGSPPCAVAWVRLSGPDAWNIASQIFEPWPAEVQPRVAHYGRFTFGDDGFALPFEIGRSYTGEESIELSIHGSKASIDNLIEACLACGARLAEPGEFTMRAFLTGRIDLTQAEGVRETCEAETDRQLRLGNQMRDGVLGEQIGQMRQQLLTQLGALEASVDFSEEIGEFDRDSCRKVADRVLAEIENLLGGVQIGRFVREGFRTAIVGPPNAGKSSLMNHILGVDRSIVTSIPGTTRDFLEERTVLDGIPLVLIDTAGLRHTEDPVERLGVERTFLIASRADAIWYLYDASQGWTEEDRQNLDRLSGPAPTVVANKSDIARAIDGLAISALTGEGVEKLVRATLSFAADAGRVSLATRRHAPLLGLVKEALAELRSALDSQAPDDLLSVLLNQAISYLGQITGETAGEDMLERIFRDFCIGK